MNNKIILASAVCITLIALTGYLIVSETFENSTKSISYYDEGHLIDKDVFEQGLNITINDYENKVFNEDYTFFGWNTSPDFLGEIYESSSTTNLNENISLYAMKIKGTIKENKGGVFDFSTLASNEDASTVLDMRFFKDISEVRIDHKTLCSIADNKIFLEIIYLPKTSLKFNEGSLVHCIALMSESSLLSIYYSENIETGLLAIEINIDDVPVSFSDESQVSISIPLDEVNEDAELKLFEINMGSEKHISSVYENKVLSFNVTDVSDFKVVPLFNVLFSQDETLSSNVLPLGFSITSDSKYFNEFKMLTIKDEFTISYSGNTPMKYRVEGVDQLSNDTFRVIGSSTVSILAYEGDGTYEIILPTKQVGYSIKSEKSSVLLGERCLINYELKSGYLDDEIIVSVNDKLVTLDSLGRLYLDNIRTDQIIRIEGVVDARSYSITLPETQIGYALTSDKENSRHGESYILKFDLSEGYEKTESFKIHLNKIVLNSSSNTIVVENVMANHNVMVTGVDLIEYSIIAGKNTVLKVGGQSSTVATINDIITVEAESGYSLPNSYNNYLSNMISANKIGYSIVDNVTFPGIVKLILGDNILVNGSSQSMLYLCSEESVTVSAKSGYNLPSNYNLSSLEGVSYDKSKYSFSEDVNIPSIYRVEYLSKGSIYKIFYQIEGEKLPPLQNPVRNYYIFSSWEQSENIVASDIKINAIWTPEKYNVSFGDNIIYEIDGEVFLRASVKELTIESVIKIFPKEGYDFPPNYFTVPDVKNEGDHYHIVDDFSFPSIYFVMYAYELTQIKFYYKDLDTHLVVNEKIQYPPLFNMELIKHEIKDFKGWFDGNKIIEGEIKIEKDILLSATWN